MSGTRCRAIDTDRPWQAQPLPQAKPAGPGGSCPHDYTSSGSFCVPREGAQDAIPSRERSPLERDGGKLFTAQSSPREVLDVVFDILSKPKFSAYINQAKKISDQASLVNG